MGYPACQGEMVYYPPSLPLNSEPAVLQPAMARQNLKFGDEGAGAPPW
jgi:hypothetical protein